jgi:hypothetical protein
MRRVRTLSVSLGPLCAGGDRRELGDSVKSAWNKVHRTCKGIGRLAGSGEGSSNANVQLALLY